MTDLFGDGNFYANIVDKYHKSVSGWLPLSVVKTSEMEQLAQATRQALQAVKENQEGAYADLTGLIHYYYTRSQGGSDPQDPAKRNYARYIEDIKQFEWYNVVFPAVSSEK